MDAILNRHQKIAFCFSGGKDSMAALYLLKPYLDRITVYHLNTGDQPKETVEIINICKIFIPNFVEINTDSKAWIKINGIPSDIVPTFNTPLGITMGFSDMLISDRFSCCWNNLMWPMHQKILDDGNTLIIRGQKVSDMPKVPFNTGAVVDGIEVLYPLENWTDSDVMQFLKEQEAPIHPVYDKLNGGIDCIHCTAWWDENHLDWLNDAYPEAAEYVAKMHIVIKEKIKMQLDTL